MGAAVIPVSGLVLGPIGTVSESNYPLIKGRKVNATDTIVPKFGDLVVLNANNTHSALAQFIASGGALTPQTPLAFAVAATQTNLAYSTSQIPGGIGSTTVAGVFSAGADMQALLKGTIVAGVNVGTPSGANAPVYIRTALNPTYPAGVVGGVEAAADAAVNTTATFTAATNTMTVASATGIVVGQIVTGAGVLANTAVTGISGTTITVSQDFSTSETTSPVNFASTVLMANGIIFTSGIVSADVTTGANSSQVTIMHELIA